MSWALLQADAADLYVAPDGTPAGPGTLSKPYDLKTALSGSVGQAGDTFWMRGGTYPLGHVDTKIHGEAGQPITFRSTPGEKPRVDGSFTIFNSIGHVIFRDFELFNSDPKRVSSQTGMGFNPTDIILFPGIQSYSPNCSFINLVIHDHTRHGIYVSQLSNGNLIYGCLIYNNGFRSPDNAEGHSLYIQGSSGHREISDNVLFNSAGAGMHVYDNSGQPVVGVTMDGNVAFNASVIQNVRAYRDWIIGADSPSDYADQIVFKNNMGYRRPGSATTRQVEMGREGTNRAVTLTDNYMPLGLRMNNWTTATVTRNTFAPRTADYAVDLQESSTVLEATWNNNNYWRLPTMKGFRSDSTAYTFPEWKSATGYDSSSTDTAGQLTGSKVFVRPNRYEAGRANIVVYNWDSLSHVPVDVSSILAPGAAYEVRNAQDFFAAPVLSGTFNGQPLLLPMDGLTVAAPLGGMLTPPPTGPIFNVFVLLSDSNANLAPTISSIGNQMTAPNTATEPIPFTVGDAETAAESLTVSGSSSNPTLVPNSGIVFGGSGSNRTVTVTPAANRTGAATITLTASDGSQSATTSFVLTVKPPVIDTVRPIVKITSPSFTSTTNGAIVVTGTASDKNGIDSVFCSINGGPFINATSSVTLTVWGTPTPMVLSPGTNTISAYCVDQAGNFSHTNTRSYFLSRRAPLTLTINGSGSVKGATNGQMFELGRNFTLTAIPAPGFVFSNWAVTTSMLMAHRSAPTLTYLMASNIAVSAQFVPNPFAAAGTFNGLFYETNDARGVLHDTSGFFTLTLSTRGTYTARLLSGGFNLTASGQFSLDGTATNAIPRKGTNALSVVWFLDSPGHTITGTVRDAGGNWRAELNGDRATFNARTNPSTLAGKYTLLLPGLPGDNLVPGGHSYGTVSIDGNGVISFKGHLADKTAAAQKVPLSRNGQWPLYVPLYSGKGSLLSWVAFTNRAGDDFHGLFHWSKPALPAARYYPLGFPANQDTLVGARYTAPVGATNRLLNLTNATLTLAGGDLPAGYTNAVVLGLNSKVTNGGPHKLSLSFSLSSGLFKGSLTPTNVGARPISFAGAVMQKSATAAGYFFGTNQSGRVTIEPAP